MSDAPLLAIDDVRHQYDDVPVLRGVSLLVEQGDAVFVIGANGAGKSTLALAISGLVRPTSGAIRLGGRDLVGLSPFAIARLGVSYTPAGRSTFPHMTVEENLELGYEARRRRFRAQRTAVRARIDEVLEVFPRLAPELRRPTHVLSGGVQRMVEVARAMMPEPQLLILDEPTLGLSGGAISELIDAVLQVRKLGTTLLVIEQNVPVATELCGRGYLLSGGRVTLSGTANEIVVDEDVRRTYLGVI